MASPASPPRPLPKLEPKPGLTFTFLSHEPKEGDPPSCAWENFKYPKLRKFPKAPSTLQFKAFLGAGTDSIVFQAKVGDDQEVAVKFFYYPKRQDELRYWSFQKECRNCSVLDMIRTALRNSDTTDDKPLFLLPKPKTREDAIRNLRTFSTEYVQRYRADPPPNFERVDASSFSYVQINDCLGWIQLEGQLLHTLIRKARCYERLPTVGWKPDPWYAAIVYKFVPEGPRHETLILDHLNFFYRVGFAPNGFKEENWRGPGILVDFSNLVLPFDSWWQRCLYGWVIKTKEGSYTLEDAYLEAHPVSS